MTQEVFSVLLNNLIPDIFYLELPVQSTKQKQTETDCWQNLKRKSHNFSHS